MICHLDYEKGSKESLNGWVYNYRILYLYTERYQTHISNTCPLSTCSSVSANALTWNNKWGRATCTYSRPKIDRKPLTTATISKSQWYALPWVIFFFSWIVIWIFYWWIMVKDVKIFSCPCVQKFSCLNVTCELRAELNVTGDHFVLFDEFPAIFLKMYVLFLNSSGSW